MAFDERTRPRRRLRLRQDPLGNGWRRAGALFVGLAAAVLGGCRGQDLYFDCARQAERFAAQAADEGLLYESIPEWEPFPVGLFLSEDGLNQLLGSSVDGEIPFTGTIPFGPAQVTFEPTSTPDIELASVEDCSRCLLLGVDFALQATQNGEPASSGVGSALLRVPLDLTSEDETASQIVARYDQARIQDMTLSIFGFDSEEHQALGGAIQVLMEEQIQAEYGARTLLSLASWELGTGDAKLLARHLVVYPEQRKLAIGMTSNLALRTGVEGLDLAEPISDAHPMAVRFHVGLMQSMAQRMLVEGEIPRRYDADGNEDPEGIYGVTLDHLRVSETEGPELESIIRVWRIADGYCGYARALMPMEVEQSGFGTVIRSGEAFVLDGEGSGAVAAREQELVDDNQHLVDTFRAALDEQVGLTVDYDGVEMEGKFIQFDTLAVEVADNRIEKQMEFIVAEAE